MKDFSYMVTSPAGVENTVVGVPVIKNGQLYFYGTAESFIKGVPGGRLAAGVVMHTTDVLIACFPADAWSSCVIVDAFSESDDESESMAAHIADLLGVVVMKRVESDTARIVIEPGAIVVNIKQ